METLSNRTVLVVEDDGLIRESLAEILELEDFDVHTAENGLEALEWLRDNPEPRLIVLDLMMPVMNGWELLGHLHDDERLSHVPVIVTSATCGTDPLPATEILQKPYEIARLLDCVKHHAV